MRAIRELRKPLEICRWGASESLARGKGVCNGHGSFLSV